MWKADSSGTQSGDQSQLYVVDLGHRACAVCDALPAEPERPYMEPH